MKLKYAYLCISCTEISDCAPRGKCSACGSEAVYPLSRALAQNPAEFLPKPVERFVNGGRRPQVERL